jgi:hypothetical protein
MSAWVAPSIAAEIWGISVEQVLAGIADGSIQSYVDGQFLFVDLGRNSFPKTLPRESIAEPVVTQEEIAALTFEPILSEPQPSLTEEEMPDAPEEECRDISHWRGARQQTTLVRRPPIADAA